MLRSIYNNASFYAWEKENLLGSKIRNVIQGTPECKKLHAWIRIGISAQVTIT